MQITLMAMFLSMFLNFKTIFFLTQILFHAGYERSTQLTTSLSSEMIAKLIVYGRSFSKAN